MDQSNTEGNEVITRSALVVAFGSHPKTKMLRALITAHPTALTPTELANMAEISRPTVYKHKDDLLKTGLVTERQMGSSSTRYGLDIDNTTVEKLLEMVDEVSEDLRKADEDATTDPTID